MKPYWEILDIVSKIMIFLVAPKNDQIWHHSHAGGFIVLFFCNLYFKSQICLGSKFCVKR